MSAAVMPCLATAALLALLQRARRFEYAGVDVAGLTAGDPVTAEQMRALFGCELLPAVQCKACDEKRMERAEVTRRLLDFKLLRENGERKHRIREVRNHGAGTDRADDLVGK